MFCVEGLLYVKSNLLHLSVVNVTNPKTMQVVLTDGTFSPYGWFGAGVMNLKRLSAVLTAPRCSWQLFTRQCSQTLPTTGQSSPDYVGSLCWLICKRLEAKGWYSRGA